MTAALDMIRGRSNIVTMTNNSGGGLVAGDVCIQDTSADENVTTTTSAASTSKVFVAAETIASAAAGKFYESGYCPLVNVSASVTRGRFLFTHTVAKQAAENATYGVGAFGKILKSGTTPSAIIYSATAQIAGAGTIGGSSGSTDNAIIRADGTGGSTVQSSLSTVDDSGGINIPTGQTYNINNVPHTHVSTGGDVFGWGTLTNPPAIGDWTALNTSSGWTGTTANNKLHMIHAGVTGDNLRGYYRALPATPKVTCAFTFIGSASDQYITAGLFAYNSSTGAAKSFTQSANGILYSILWPSVTSENTEVALLQGSPRTAAVWMQYEQDGTNRYVRVGINGVHWITILTETKTTYVTADSIGFMIYAAASPRVGMASLIHWLEE